MINLGLWTEWFDWGNSAWCCWLSSGNSTTYYFKSTFARSWDHTLLSHFSRRNGRV